MATDDQRRYWRVKARRLRREQREARVAHVHDRGLRLPDGSRTCFRCYVAKRLAVKA